MKDLTRQDKFNIGLNLPGQCSADKYTVEVACGSCSNLTCQRRIFVFSCPNGAMIEAMPVYMSGSLIPANEVQDFKEAAIGKRGYLEMFEQTVPPKF